ncbi:MAG: mechanosensitive ion channel [Acidobacteria bacterium]|nr:mechanosensitive ion channel [Acidobacteriota bacterium]
MDATSLFARIKDILNFPLLRLGEAEITLWTLIYFLALLLFLFYLARKIKMLLVEQVLTRTRLDVGARQAIGSITRYLVLLIGLLIILQTVGINLTTLNVIAGAVGIGVGFGLQNIASNFISGLIILFERPIKIGDRIVVGDVEGDVTEIGAHSTTVVTNNRIAIIVPNSMFISEPVINWQYTDRKVRFEIPVGVAYGSDARLVERLLLEVAKENPDVLSDPAPDVCFREFGDSSLNFVLRVWNQNHVHRKLVLHSALNFAIYDKFKEHGIEIPFPQRDLHIRSGMLETKTSA